MFSRLLVPAVGLVTLGLVVTAQQQSAPAPAPASPPAAPANPSNLGSDANGNPLRKALKTGHVSNYDETKTGTYTLPDPLMTSAGRPVRDSNAWRSRRAEIVALYEANIYGRIPPTAPKVTWQVAETDPKAREGVAVRKKVVGAVGSSADGPRITVTLASTVIAWGLKAMLTQPFLSVAGRDVTVELDAVRNADITDHRAGSSAL